MSKLVTLNARQGSSALQLNPTHSAFVNGGINDVRAPRVDRHKLLPLIRSNLNKHIIYISAALGSGKSTFISDAFSRYSPIVFELTPNDNLAKSFFHKLTLAIQQHDDTFSAFVLCPDDDQQILARQYAADMYVSEINRVAAGKITPLIIVLDDLHHIHGAFWAPLLEHIIESTENVVWVLSSEYPHTLDFTATEAKGDLFRLGEEDMFFSEEETRQLLCQAKPGGHYQELLTTIKTRNGCWPYGAEFAYCFLRKTMGIGKLPVGASTASPTLYLVDQLLDEMPQEVRNFIAATAFLNRFNLELCQFLLNSADCAFPLLELEHLHTVVIKDEVSTLCYRYHPVLHEHLKQRSEALPVNIKNQFVARACRWLIEQKFLEEAFQIAQLHSHPLFIYETQHQCLIRWIKSGDIDSVLMWQQNSDNNTLPLSDADRLAWFWTLAFSGRTQIAQLELTLLLHSALNEYDANPGQAVERLFLNPKNRFQVNLAVAYTWLENMKAPMSQQLLGNLKTLRKHSLVTPTISAQIENILAHHFADCRDLLRAQHHLNIARNIAEERNNHQSLTICAFTQARLELLNGNLNTALDICDLHLSTSVTLENNAAFLLMRALRAKILYYGTNPQQGLSEAHQLVESDISRLNRDGVALTLIPILRQHQRNRRFSQAEDLLAFLEQCSVTMCNQGLTVQVVLERFRSALLQNDLAKIEKWVNIHQLPGKVAQCLDSSSTMEWSIRENWILCAVIYHISQSRFTEASRLTGQLLYLNIECGFQVRYLPISMLQAWLEFCVGRRSSAFSKLNQILTQAEISSLGFGLFDIIPDASEFVRFALEDDRVESPTHQRLLHQLGYRP